jgi:RimJ/RimL family protein N-acetyltransferase
MIEGKNVGLRAIESDDLQQLRDWRNLTSFRRNFREHKELNMINQNKWFDKVSSSANDYMFIIQSLKSEERLGACGLLYINWITRSADFSFYIGHDERYIDNSNLSLEAAELLISYGFNNLHLNKIWMELYEFDSKKIDFFSNKMGFKVDGRLRSNCFEDGRYYDSFILSLLRKDYN